MNAGDVDLVVDAELVDDGPGTELVVAAPRWVPTGKAAAALMGQLAEYDPDGRLSAEAAAMFRAGEADSTVDTMAYQFLRYLVWFHDPERPGYDRDMREGRQALPADKTTVQEWITANYTMKNAAGKLRGRNGQPYSPATVRLSLAAIARAHRRYFSRHTDELARYFQEHPGELEAAAARRGRDRGAMPTPTAHDDVVQTMKGYAKTWKRAGYREDVADSITVDELYAMVRTFDLSTVAGLRDAALMRLAADIGRRNAELMALNWADLKWQTPTLLVVTVPFSKTNQDAEAGDTAYVEADDGEDALCPELCTLLLLREWKELSAARGFTDGPVFRQVRGTGQARKDGGHRGVILPARMERKNYVDVVAMAARKARIDRDSAGDERKIVPHSLRVFMARRTLAAGGTIGQVCDQGGWSRNSPVVLRYDRQAAGEREGHTPGALIRRAERARRDEAAAAEAARVAAGGEAHSA